MSKESVKNILDQRKQIWLWGKESKKVILDMIKMYRDSPEIVENLFLHKKMPFQEEILNILGLWDDIQDSLTKYIENKNFNEDNELFKELNRLFEWYYDIASRVYKYDNKNNSIKLIYWNPEEFVERINLSDPKNGHYMTELDSIKKWNDSKFFYNRSVKSFWSKWSIWINILDEKFIFVFWDSKSPEKDIKKIRSLFDIGNLRKIIKNNLILIREKYRDNLTWVYNLRYINEIMQDKIFSIIFIDIDNFKQFNDYYSYSTGDLVLKEVSNVLVKSIKHWDKICRYAWDEFVIFIKQNDENVILSMKKRIENNLIGRNQNTELKVELSIGYSMYDESKDFTERLIEAWKDMHDSKNKDWERYRILNCTKNLSEQDKIKTAAEILWIIENNERQFLIEENCAIAKSWNCPGWFSTKKE